MDDWIHHWTMGMLCFRSSLYSSSYPWHSHRTLSWLEFELTVSMFWESSCARRGIDRIATVWIPLLEIGWTIFTFAIAGAQSYSAMLGLRFVVGLLEAGYWPALYYILGSWYTKCELLFIDAYLLRRELHSLFLHQRRAWKAQRHPSVGRLDRPNLQWLLASRYLQ